MSYILRASTYGLEKNILRKVNYIIICAYLNSEKPWVSVIFFNQPKCTPLSTMKGGIAVYYNGSYQTC